MSTILSSSSSSSSVHPSTSVTSTNVPIVRVSIYHEGTEVSNILIEKNLQTSPPVEIIDDTPYSYNYTGRHDGGPLPPIPTHNIYGHIVEAIKEAKLSVDQEIQKLVPPRPPVPENSTVSTKTVRKTKDQGPNKKKQRQQTSSSQSDNAAVEMNEDDEVDNADDNNDVDDDNDEGVDEGINNDE